MNQTLGIIAALLTVGCWTIGTFAFTAASKLVSPLSVNRVRLLFAFVLITFISVLFSNISLLGLFTAPDFQQWFWLGVSGIIGLSIGDYFAFSAYRIIGSSKASLFSAIAPVAALLLGMVLLGENINWVGIAGMAISVTGILWFISVQQRTHANTHHPFSKSELYKGLLFAALGSISQGLGLVCAKKGLIHTGDITLTPLHATWIRMGIGAGITYVIGVFRSNLITEFKLIALSKINIKPVLLGTLFGPVIGVSMSMLAATNLEVSLAQTIFSLLPISVMFVAQVLGKEKLSFTAIAAACISICGVLILVWRNAF